MFILVTDEGRMWTKKMMNFCCLEVSYTKELTTVSLCWQRANLWEVFRMEDRERNDKQLSPRLPSAPSQSMNYNHDKDVKRFWIGSKFNDSGFPIFETSRLFEEILFCSLCKKMERNFTSSSLTRPIFERSSGGLVVSVLDSGASSWCSSPGGDILCCVHG